MVNKIYLHHLKTNKSNTFVRKIFKCVCRKYSVSLKTFLQQDVSEPEFYGDLFYRIRKTTVGQSYFSEQLRKLINRYLRTEYNLDIM